MSQFGHFFPLDIFLPNGTFLQDIFSQFKHCEDTLSLLPNWICLFFNDKLIHRKTLEDEEPHNGDEHVDDQVEENESAEILSTVLEKSKTGTQPHLQVLLSMSVHLVERVLEYQVGDTSDFFLPFTNSPEILYVHIFNMYRYTSSRMLNLILLNQGNKG